MNICGLPLALHYSAIHRWASGLQDPVSPTQAGWLAEYWSIQGNTRYSSPRRRGMRRSFRRSSRKRQRRRQPRQERKRPPRLKRQQGQKRKRQPRPRRTVAPSAHPPTRPAGRAQRWEARVPVGRWDCSRPSPPLGSPAGVGTCPRWRAGVGVGPQEAARIAKLKVEALKVVSQIAPVKCAFASLKESPHFAKLPKPLQKKCVEATKTISDISDEADSRAAGKNSDPLPWSLDDVKEAIKTGTLGV